MNHMLLLQCQLTFVLDFSLKIFWNFRLDNLDTTFGYPSSYLGLTYQAQIKLHSKSSRIAIITYQVCDISEIEVYAANIIQAIIMQNISILTHEFHIRFDYCIKNLQSLQIFRSFDKLLLIFIRLHPTGLGKLKVMFKLFKLSFCT